MLKTKFKKYQAASAAFASLTSAFSLVLATLALTSCAPSVDTSLSPIMTGVDRSLGCKNFEDTIWTAFNKSIEEKGRPPEAAELEAALRANMKTSARLGKLSSTTQAKISGLMGEIIATVGLRTENAAQSFTGAQNSKPGATIDNELQRGLWLERVAQLEIGDRTTIDKSNDVDQIRAKIEQLKAVAEESGLAASCETAPPDASATDSNPTAMSASQLFDSWQATLAAPVYGGMKSIATMYQSCDAATRGPLGSDVGNVQGISVVGKHPQGVGNVRQVTNKTAFLASHPYVGRAVYRRPLPSCHDVQALPSIYDYGGKPYTSASNEKEMNFFKNAGTGSKELGIDCSGLVFSAYATSGLKFKKGTLKATFVNGISSTMLTQPQRNGLTCLDHATFNSRTNLMAGDIIAIAGHVVMVSEVGNDPFGIAGISSSSQCTLGNMSIARFNFNIMQSSPSKGGIGVNRMRARDYLTSTSAMGQGMLAHAVNACRAKFQSAPIVSTSSKASVVRHLGTSDCKDPVPVKLTDEDCLNSCSVSRFDSI
jgi:hypothetical protein